MESLGIPRVSVVGADVAWLEVKDWMSDLIKSDSSALLQNWRPNYIILLSHGILLRFADSKLQVPANNIKFLSCVFVMCFCNKLFHLAVHPLTNGFYIFINTFWIRLIAFAPAPESHPDTFFESR